MHCFECGYRAVGDGVREGTEANHAEEFEAVVLENEGEGGEAGVVGDEAVHKGGEEVSGGDEGEGGADDGGGCDDEPSVAFQISQHRLI